MGQAGKPVACAECGALSPPRPRTAPGWSPHGDLAARRWLCPVHTEQLERARQAARHRARVKANLDGLRRALQPALNLAIAAYAGRGAVYAPRDLGRFTGAKRSKRAQRRQERGW